MATFGLCPITRCQYRVPGYLGTRGINTRVPGYRLRLGLQNVPLTSTVPHSALHSLLGIPTLSRHAIADCFPGVPGYPGYLGTRNWYTDLRN
eukprot:3937143-Rhodomonas_salina.1